MVSLAVSREDGEAEEVRGGRRREAGETGAGGGRGRKIKGWVEGWRRGEGGEQEVFSILFVFH